jgi:hypothetical protein
MKWPSQEGTGMGDDADDDERQDLPLDDQVVSLDELLRSRRHDLDVLSRRLKRQHDRIERLLDATTRLRCKPTTRARA